jgi:hypothetical protein
MCLSKLENVCISGEKQRGVALDAGIFLVAANLEPSVLHCLFAIPHVIVCRSIQSGR